MSMQWTPSPHLSSRPLRIFKALSPLKQVIEFYLGVRSTALLNIQQSHPKKILVLLSNISSDHFWEATLLLSARQQTLRDLAQLFLPHSGTLLCQRKRVLSSPHLPSLPHAASKTWGVSPLPPSAMWGLFRWAHKSCLGRKLRGQLWTSLFPLVSSMQGWSGQSPYGV